MSPGALAAAVTEPEGWCKARHRFRLTNTVPSFQGKPVVGEDDSATTATKQTKKKKKKNGWWVYWSLRFWFTSLSFHPPSLTVTLKCARKVVKGLGRSDSSLFVSS